MLFRSMPVDSTGVLVEQSGSGLIALNEEASWVFAEGSRYRLFVSYLGMDDADGYNKYNFYLYDSETHHLTMLVLGEYKALQKYFHL